MSSLTVPTAPGVTLIAGVDAVTPVPVRLMVIGALLALLLIEMLPEAAPVNSPGPEVRKYLKIATPRVILEHVQVIDGTGAGDAFRQLKEAIK